MRPRQSGLLETFCRIGVRPDSVQVLGGTLSFGLPTRVRVGPTSYEGVYLERRRGAGFGLYNAVGIKRDDMDGRVAQMLENFRFFGAPHVAVISSPMQLGTYGAVDCGVFVSTLLAAAQSLGMSTIAQAAVAMYADFVHEFLNIPRDRNIVCAVSFGFEDPHHRAKGFHTERAGLDDVVTHLG